MRYNFPAGYGTGTCYLVPIDAALLPLVAGALKLFEERRSWVSDDDHEQGYNAFAELQICMTKLCVDALIESNDRLYRMLDTAIYGRAYAVVDSIPELVVDPPIEPTHELTIESPESILGRMDVLRQLLENALNGTPTESYDRELGVRDLLESIKASIEAGDELDDDMLAKLGEIAVLIA